MADSTKTSQGNEADSMLELAEKLRDGKECAQDVNRAFVLAYEAVAKGRRAILATSGIHFVYARRWKFFFINLLAALACVYGFGGNVMLNIYGWGYLLATWYVAKEL